MFTYMIYIVLDDSHVSKTWEPMYVYICFEC